MDSWSGSSRGSVWEVGDQCASSHGVLDEWLHLPDWIPDSGAADVRATEQRVGGSVVVGVHGADSGRQQSNWTTQGTFVLSLEIPLISLLNKIFNIYMYYTYAKKYYPRTCSKNQNDWKYLQLYFPKLNPNCFFRTVCISRVCICKVPVGTRKTRVWLKLNLCNSSAPFQLYTSNLSSRRNVVSEVSTTLLVRSYKQAHTAFERVYFEQS